MLFRKLYPDRWFIWTLVFLFVAGSGLIAYAQWTTLELGAESDVAVGAIVRHR